MTLGPAKSRKRSSRNWQFELLEWRRLLAVAALPTQPLNVAPQPIAVESGLIDNDAVVDLVTLSPTGVLSVALNSPSASGINTWRSLQQFDVALGLGSVRGMASGSLNSDAILDLVIIGDQTARLLYGDGQGGFSSTSSPALGPTLDPPSGGRFAPSDSGVASGAIGLVNGDSLGDIVLLDIQNNQVVIYYTQSNGQVSAPVTYATGGLEPTAVAIADVVGDTVTDIIVGHRDGTLSFLQGATDGTFQIDQTATVRNLAAIRALSVADVDDDGDFDLAVAASTEAILLVRGASPLKASPIENGDFSNGLLGWTIDAVGHAAGQSAGTASGLGGLLQLQENDSLLTSVHQSFTIPPNPQSISIDVAGLGLEHTAGAIPDAFELSLLAQDATSLVQTHRPAATSYFSASASGSGLPSIKKSAQATWDGRVVTLDISAIPAGTQATLFIDLVGNPPGNRSTAQVASVSISPSTLFSHSFTRIALNPINGQIGRPMVQAQDIAIGDVDGDGFQDIVVADAGSSSDGQASSGRLLVFNGTEPHPSQVVTFAEASEITSTTLGGHPMAIALNRYRAARFTDDIPVDIAAVLNGPVRVVTTLGADTKPPTAIVISPVDGSRVNGSLSEFRIQFSENVLDLGPLEDHSVTNLAAWSAYEFGINGVDDGGAGDDRLLPLGRVSYDRISLTAVVTLAAASLPLGEGRYGLTLRGQDRRFSIRDLLNNDLNGGSDTSIHFSVDRPPIIDRLQFYPPSPTEGQLVTLIAVARDAGLGAPYAAQIVWGDGQTTNFSPGSVNIATPISAQHRYALAGSYSVRITISDEFGQSASMTQLVSVIEDKGLWIPNIDFERDATGKSIPSKAVLVDQFYQWGIKASGTSSDDGHHHHHEKDRILPTIVNWSREVDRSTPGNAARGNVLVLAKDIDGQHDDDYHHHHKNNNNDDDNGDDDNGDDDNNDDDNNDNDRDDDDNDDGIKVQSGTLTLAFETAVMLDDVKLLGLKTKSSARLRAYTADGQLIRSLTIHGNATGSEQLAGLSARRVARLNVDFNGRGAISEIVFCRDLSPPGSNETASRALGSALPEAQLGLGGPISIGQVVTSSLTTGGQTVDWTFAASAGQKIYVNFQALSDTIQSELLAPDGTLLATSFSSRASGLDSGTLTLLSSGTFTLRLSSDTTPSYQFQIFDVPAPDTRPITFGQVHSDALNTPGRQDHWNFQATAGSRYYLDFLSLETVVGGDLVVEITSPSGAILSTRTSTRSFGLDQGFAIPLGEGGTTTIVLRAVFDGSHLPVYSFQLFAVPDDDIRPLAYRQVANGQIEVPGARDQWQFTASAGQALFFDMQSISGGDVRAQVIDPNGTILTERTFSLASGLDQPLIVSSAGLHTIVLDAAGGANLIGYQFQLWDVPPEVTRAGLINTTLSGSTVPGERAIYEFEANAGTPILLDVIQSSNQALGITLVDPSGQTIIERANSDGLFDLTSSGTYRAIVSPASPFFSDGFGQYTFRIQDRSSPAIGNPDQLGTRFYVAFPPNLRQPFAPNNPVFSLTIASQTETSGTVQIPGINFFTSYAVAAGQSTRIELPSSVELSDSDFIDSKGVLITALDEVAVFGLDQMEESTDGFTAMPTDAIGRDYYLLGYANTIVYVVGGGTSLTLAAAHDNTQVTITPTVAVGSRAAGVPFIINLDAGQAYTLHTSLPFLADLSGTRVTSTQPVSLFGGNTAARVPEGFAAADHLIEQMPPTETWGTRFVTQPLATRTGGDTFRFLAQRNNTQIRINGQLSATLDAGAFVERLLTSASVIESSQPILLAQYANSTAFDGVTSDPFMMLIPPVEQFLNQYTLTTPLGGIDINYANLVVPTSGLTSVTLDGTLVPPNLFAPIGQSGYWGGQVPISVGSHRFESSQPFGVSIYGFADFESYGYFGGMSLGRVASASSLQLSPPAATMPIGTLHTVSALVLDSNGDPLRGVRVDFEFANITNSGAMEPGFAFTGSDGRASIRLTRNIADSITITARVGNGAGALTKQAVARWQSAAPSIEVMTPMNNSSTYVGKQLISGIARPGSPGTSIAEVTIDGRRVEAVDATGNFFATVELRLGIQNFTVLAIDSSGAQATTVLTLTGLASNPRKFDVTSSSDITQSARLEYSDTTFHRGLNRLSVKLQLINDSPSDNPALLDRNVAVRFDSISPTRVTVANPDGFSPGNALTRRPLIVFDSELPLNGLRPGQITSTTEIHFADPERDRLAVTTSILARNNRPPRFTSTPLLAATVGQLYRYAARAIDPDASRLSYALLAAPSGMRINATTGAITWVARANQVAAHQVVVRVDDERGGSAVQQFTLSAQVAHPNRPPRFTSTPVTSVTPGADYRYSVRATDSDGDQLQYSLLSAPNGMTIDSSTGVIAYPSAVEGSYAVEVQVTDPRAGSATQSFQLRVGIGTAIPSPNVVSSPPAIGRAGDYYIYTVTAVDPQGSRLSYALLGSPTGMSIDALTGRITWLPAAGDVGLHLVRVEVRSQAGGTATQSYTLDILAAKPNAQPLFASQPNRIATVGTQYSYEPLATDPEGQPLRYTLLRSPIGMTIDGNTGRIVWTPTANQIGSQGVSIVATDPQGSRANQQFVLTVRSTNTPPQFTSTPGLAATVGSAYRYNVQAVDDHDEVTYSLATAPAGMLIDPRSGAITFVPTATSIGSQAVLIRARDARGLEVDQSYTLNVSDDSQGPSVSLLLSKSQIEVGQSVRMQVVALDSSGIRSVKLSIDGQLQSLDATRAVTFTATRPGIPRIVASATDTRGNSSTATADPQLRVIDPNDTTAPEINVTSPTPGQRVTYLTDVIGSVVDDNLEFYRFEISPAGMEQWVTRSVSERSPISNGVLAQFDPTMLANDFYDLRIVAQDYSGNQSTRKIEISVEGGAKIGFFSTAASESYCDCSAKFVDLEVPVAGIPIRIARSYSTLDAAYIHDFGYGWRLDVTSPRIRESVRISPSEAAGGGPLVANPFRTGSRVYLNAPDGRRVGFTFDPKPTGGLLGAVWTPRFRPDPGVDMELTVEATSLSQQSDGTFHLYLYGLPYNPDRYTLTTRDSVRYTYDQFDTISLQSIEDRNGVRLTIDQFGIHSSLGPEVLWTRDSLGRITNITHPDGGIIRYGYSAQGELISHTTATDDVTTFSYLNQPAHYLESITDPRGVRLFSLTYDADGRITGHTDALDQRATMSYDLENNQEKIVDRLGHETTLVFDDRGNITRRIDPLGHSTSWSYDANDNEISITDQRGFTTRYEYDDHRNVTKRIDALGREMTTSYNLANDPLTRIDELGRIQSATYDARGNLASVTDAAGGTQSFVYETAGRLASRIDYGGNETRFSYVDSNFELPSITFDPVPVGQAGRPAVLPSTPKAGTIGAQAGQQLVQVVEFNRRGLHERIVDQLGYETHFRYDLRGRLLSIQDALGGLWTNEYSGNLLVAKSDALGRRTRYEYDGNERLMRIIDPLGSVYAVDYDANGDPVRWIDPLGRVSHFVFNARQELISITDPSGAETRFEYDPAGNHSATIDPNGLRTTYVYDGLNRLIGISDSIHTVGAWTLDAVGNVLTYTNGMGEQETFQYDALNRMLASTNARGAVHQYEFDAMSNVTALVDPMGNRTQYVYDAKQRLIKQIDPLGQSSQYSYDAVDNLAQMVDRNGRMRQFSYDGLRRATSETWLVGVNTLRTIDYRYDAASNLLSVVDPDTDHRFTYDGLDRMLTDTAAATTRTPSLALTFGYDAVGNRTLIADDSGVTVSSTYESRDLVATRTWTGGGTAPARVDWSYDARGDRIATNRYSDAQGLNRVGRTLVNRDARGRSVSTTHYNSVDAVLADYDWHYDLADRLVEERANGQTSQYTYNAAGELVGADLSLLPDETYALDLNGNRTSGTTLGTNNRLLSDSFYQYSYDGEGNLIRKTEIATGHIFTYGYDHRNRLIRFEHRDASQTLVTSADYLFDAFDRRVAKSVTQGGVTTTIATMYVNEQAWADFDSSGHVSVRYLYSDGSDELVASWSTATGTQWYLADRLGTIRDVTGSDGLLVNHIEYTPFGSIVSQTNPARSSRFTYTGREHDTESGLYYYRSRMYDSSTGRFTTQDPLQFAGGDSNLYRYVGHSPTNFTDPFGLTAMSEGGAIETKEAKEAPGKIYLACMMQEIYATVAFAAIGIPPTPIDLAQSAIGCAVGPIKGPGTFTTLVEKMSERAAAYQRRITGLAENIGYLVKGTKFDGFDGAAGVLLDAKGPGYAKFIKDGVFKPWWRGADELVEQAQRQLVAAGGTPIRWHVAEKEAADAIRNVLISRGIAGIKIVFTP